MNLRVVRQYLAKHQILGLDLPLAEKVPDLVVVIPCFDEPEIHGCLDSLDAAMCVGVNVEVVVVVNDGEQHSEAVVAQNDRTYDLLNRWQKEGRYSYELLVVRLQGVRRKHAGAGYARKVGLDLALWRLAEYGAENAPLVSLDADTIVATNYFSVLAACFSDEHTKGAIIRFEHPVKGERFSEAVYLAVSRYELHLRYLNQALKYSQYPYVCHTIGSAFAVRAAVYAKHGGMNRRQGGEDFYFIHKLLPHEHFVELNKTCVYPSSRPSHRVPFGTGPQVKQSMQSDALWTYNPEVFDLLKTFISQVPLLYKQNLALHPLFYSFFCTNNYEEKLKEIRKNAATKASFVKRFFVYFDAFQLVKFLNFSHQKTFKKIKVEEAAQVMLQKMDEDKMGDLLLTYRKIEGR